jgi:TetR/AcrR family transcriptional regulator
MKVVTESSKHPMSTPTVTMCEQPTALKIIDAAEPLFMQRGYRAVSINEIIRAAEVTKPTLYYYFADKEELYVQMGLRLVQTMGDRLQAAVEQSDAVESRLLALAGVLLATRDGDMRLMRHEMIEHLSEEARLVMADAFYTQLFAPIEQVMQAGLAVGLLARYSSHDLAMMFLSLSEAFYEFAPGASRDQWGGTGQVPFAATHFGPNVMVDLFLNGVKSN